MSVVLMLLAALPKILVAFVALLTAAVGFFMLIPGEQPEKFLQKVLDFIQKFSRK